MSNKVLKANDVQVPRTCEDGVVRMVDIPDWWRGSVQDIEDTVRLVKKGHVEVLCETPGKRPVYLIRYGKKNDLKRTATYSSAIGGYNYSYYADKRGEDYVPTVAFIGAEHGGEFEGVVALNNLIKNIETGTDYAGNENRELMEALEGLNLLIIPCLNVDGRARIPLRTMAGQDYEGFLYHCHGTWKNGSLCVHPYVKQYSPIKDYCEHLGGYYNDDGVNIVHDNFFFPMAEETKALFRVADEYVPDISIHLHGGGNARNQFYQFNYLPNRVKTLITELNDQLEAASNAAGIGDHFFKREVKEYEDIPCFNVQSAWTALCGEAAIVYESNQGLIYPKGKAAWDRCLTMDEIYQHHRILFETTFKYLKSKKVYPLFMEGYFKEYEGQSKEFKWGDTPK